MASCCGALGFAVWVGLAARWEMDADSEHGQISASPPGRFMGHSEISVLRSVTWKAGVSPLSGYPELDITAFAMGSWLALRHCRDGPATPSFILQIQSQCNVFQYQILSYFSLEQNKSIVSPIINWKILFSNLEICTREQKLGRQKHFCRA